MSFSLILFCHLTFFNIKPSSAESKQLLTLTSFITGAFWLCTRFRLGMHVGTRPASVEPCPAMGDSEADENIPQSQPSGHPAGSGSRKRGERAIVASKYGKHLLLIYSRVMGAPLVLLASRAICFLLLSSGTYIHLYFRSKQMK
jgi:hypothetical protein